VQYHRLDTHLHAMEACSALLAADGDRCLHDCWADLASRICARAFDPESGSVQEIFLPGSGAAPANMARQIHCGHNLEAAWLLGVSADALSEPGLEEIAVRLLDFSLSQAHGPGLLDHHPEMWFPGPVRPGQPVAPGEEQPALTWWAQCEGLGALAFHYRRRPSPVLLDCLERLWAFVTSRFADPIHGEWLTSVRPGGEIVDDTKGGDWKAAYHVVQALARTAGYLDGSQQPGGWL
jgi:mannose/cellobiose epimerase-like protein (N-acyl-D-glucosamine 2-epimerase family)